MPHALIVEDDEENRDLLRMLLKANAYKVTVAGDGLEALAAARRDPPDVVVSDVLMPKMDGFALCREWTQDAALKAIPFIFYSATYVHTDDEQFAKALGSVAYLPKPLEAEVFLRELRALVQQWAGHAVPAPSLPLDDSAFHTLHESALARAIEDKIALLEASNRRLQESEARFRSLTKMSSDYFWESDAEHRLISRSSQRANLSDAAALRDGTQIGKPRWGSPYLSPDEDGWRAHRADLDVHRPFRNFEFSRLGRDGKTHYVVISGDPVFDASGSFTGYRGVGTDITERKRGEEALRRFNTAMDAITDAIYLVDRASMRFIHINDAACRMRKQTREEIFALGPEGVLSITREELEHIYDQIIAGGGVAEPLELQRTRADGSQMWLELRHHAQRSGDSWTIVTLARDITDRKAAEATILRLSQLYAALSKSNAAIARSNNEAELAWEICRIAVRYGGMSMAWIGLVDPSTRAIRPAASFGEHAAEHLQDIKLSVDSGSPYGRGPVGISIRENRPEWFQDFQNDPRAAPWHKDSRRFGWRSAFSLPLRRNRVPIGALVLYAVDAGVFELAVRKLLIEMATDIDFALDNFAREATRARAEHDLRAAEEQFRGLVEQPIAGIFIIQDDKLAYVNPRFAEIFGYASADDLIGRESLSLVIEKERSAVLDMRRKIESGAQSMNYGFTAARKDGTLIEVGVHGARATHKGRPAVIGMLLDLSEKKRAEESIQR